MGKRKDVLDYIRHYAHICAAQYSGGISSRAPIAKEKMKETSNLGNKLFLDIKEKRIFPAQMGMIEKYKEYFKKIIQMRKHEWIEEYQYWQNMGWL